MSTTPTPPRIVRSRLKTNVGHPGANRTLWIFGAGASFHLEFPLSFNFFEKSVLLVTATFKEPNPITLLSLKKADGSPASDADFKLMKTDAGFALEQMHLWDYVPPEDRNVLVRFQYLVNEWKAVSKLLHDAGHPLTPADLLSRNPENLIDELRHLPPSPARHVQLARNNAEACVGRIYFYTLSHFNDSARDGLRTHRLSSRYRRLVKLIDNEGEHRFISFNYDTMLDESLFLDYTKSWQYAGVEIAAINGYPVAAGPEAELLYVKPHGSLNLTFCPNCRRAQIRWYWAVKPRGAGELVEHNRTCVQCRTPLPKRAELVSDMLVPPLYNKHAVENSISAIEEAFAWADNIVTIGFSFPDQDAYFLDCMAKGLVRNGNSRVTLHLVDKDGPSATALKARVLAKPQLDVLGQPKFRVIDMQCDGFLGVEINIENIPEILGPDGKPA